MKPWTPSLGVKLLFLLLLLLIPLSDFVRDPAEKSPSITGVLSRPPPLDVNVATGRLGSYSGGLFLALGGLGAPPVLWPTVL